MSLADPGQGVDSNLHYCTLGALLSLAARQAWLPVWPGASFSSDAAVHVAEINPVLTCDNAQVRQR